MKCSSEVLFGFCSTPALALVADANGPRYVTGSNAVDRVCQIGFRFGRILPRPLSQMPKPTIEIFNYEQIEFDKDNAPWHRHELFSISAYFYVIGSDLSKFKIWKFILYLHFLTIFIVFLSGI